MCYDFGRGAERRSTAYDVFLSSTRLKKRYSLTKSPTRRWKWRGSETAANYTLYFCTALDLCPGP